MNAIYVDSTTLVLIVLALVIIIIALIFRQKIGVNIKSLGGTEVNITATNQLPPSIPAVNIEDVTSRSGGVQAIDETGRGATIKKVGAEGDIKVTSTLPPGKL